MKAELIKVLCERTGDVTAGTTVLRGTGKGVRKNAKKFLMDLHRVDPPKFAGCKTEAQFKALLDKKTIELKGTLPGKAKKNWGVARKMLNLYLRDMLYYRYLCSHFGFCHLEKWLEVPLDSWTAKGIRHDYEHDGLGILHLPRWKLKDLTPEVSEDYQKAAKAIATQPKNRFARVHLDLLYWRNIGRQIPN